MKALKYKIKVQIDPVHSWGDRVIDEIFIPSIGCCFNQEGFAFLSESPRRNKGIEEVEIDEEEVSVLKQYCKFKTKLEQICEKNFPKDSSSI